MERAAAKFVGRQAILWALVLSLVLPTLPVLAAENDDSGDDPSTTPRLYFEPIAGLTTIRHLAPSQTAIPLGTVLDLFLDAPEDAVVIFSGATVTSRNAEGIKARCFLDREGPANVTAIGEMPDGTKYIMAACRLDVVSIAIGDISATVTTPTVAPFDLDENASNEETWSYYSGESIARLVETTPSVSDAIGLDGGRRRPGSPLPTRRFRTSISRRINFHVDVDPPAFAPLMEWRIDELDSTLGTEREVMFRSVGEHTVSVGPLNRTIDVVIDTYRVSITSHDTGADIVPEGELITFEAVTDPPGYQDDITWLSSTKYGTGAPVRGQGATFTVQFDNTWGDHPTNGYFQWLGLRADNARFNQDQKSFPMAGTDIIEHDLQIGFDMGDDGTIDEVFLFNGVMEIQRCDPFTNAQGFRQIDFLVTDWFAVASSDILEAEIVYVISDGVTQDVSTIISQFDNRDFPARFKFNVIFDVFVDGILEFSQHHGMPQGDDFFVVPPNGDRSKSPTMTTFEEETVFFVHPVLGPLRFVPIDCNDQNSSTVAGVPPNCPAP